MGDYITLRPQMRSLRIDLHRYPSGFTVVSVYRHGEFIPVAYASCDAADARIDSHQRDGLWLGRAKFRLPPAELERAAKFLGIEVLPAETQPEAAHAGP